MSRQLKLGFILHGSASVAGRLETARREPRVHRLFDALR
jgi:hypothetical protein